MDDGQGGVETVSRDAKRRKVEGTDIADLFLIGSTSDGSFLQLTKDDIAQIKANLNNLDGRLEAQLIPGRFAKEPIRVDLCPRELVPLVKASLMHGWVPERLTTSDRIVKTRYFIQTFAEVLNSLWDISVLEKLRALNDYEMSTFLKSLSETQIVTENVAQIDAFSPYLFARIESHIESGFPSIQYLGALLRDLCDVLGANVALALNFCSKIWQQIPETVQDDLVQLGCGLNLDEMSFWMEREYKNKQSTLTIFSSESRAGGTLEVLINETTPPQIEMRYDMHFPDYQLQKHLTDAMYNFSLSHIRSGTLFFTNDVWGLSTSENRHFVAKPMVQPPPLNYKSFLVGKRWYFYAPLLLSDSKKPSGS